MTPQELKNSVLQLAIQGKLVEQRAEEGTAEELYEQIQQEKQRLIAEKKIKKEKGSYNAFKDDEILFEIPITWKWVRFGSIMINRDSERIPLSVAERSKLKKTFDYYGASGVIDKVDRYLFDKTLLLIGEDGANLLTRSTPIAYLAKGKYWVNNHAHVLDCIDDTLSLEYIMYFINAISLAKYVTGTAQPKMNQEKMNSIPVPLPPLAEQKRIVEKIEQILPYIDQYEKAWGKLETFNKRFPDDMKKSLLQYAIEGKLVEQRPEEGTAEELYQQIQQEKQRLIAEKKIKKEKPLPEITDDEIPFDIPDSWKWVRLGSILNKLVDGAHKTPKYTESGIPFVSVKNISSGKLDMNDTKFISKDEHKQLCERCNPEKGDILLSKVGTTGVPAKVDTDEEFSLFVSVALLKFNSDLINIDFLIYAILSPDVQKQCTENTRGVGNKNWVMKDIANTIFPLPPLAEQKRIIEKLEQMLPLCERLK